MKQSLLIIVILVFTGAYAQKQKAVEDYHQAVQFLYANYSKNTYNLHIYPNWFEDNTGLSFIKETEDGRFYKKVMFRKELVSDLFDHAAIASQLTTILGEEVKPGELPFEEVNYPSSREIHVVVDKKHYKLKTKTSTLEEYSPEVEEEKVEHLSPDGQWQAYTEGFNLFVKHVETGEVKQLSDDGEKDFAYGSWYGWTDLMEGENGERPEHFGVNWSPGSDWIQVDICDVRTANKMYLLDWSIDSLYRPKLLSYFRGSPGDTGMVKMHTVFFNIKTGKRVDPKLPEVTHINPNEVRWSKDEEKVFLFHTTRGYKEVEWFSLNLNTEEMKSIYKEVSETNIESFESEIYEELGEIFFFSEKSGWKQVYAVNIESGKVEPITGGEFYLSEYVNVDKKLNFFFKAAGVNKHSNPYYEKLYRKNLKGGRMLSLTPEDLHHAVSMNENATYFVDNMSTADTPTRSVLRDAKSGRIIVELARADVSKLKGRRAPKLFEAIARDGKTPIYGALWLPSNFDENKKYPIIDHSYTGPHTNMFPREFRYSFSDQALAELGFIVIRVDGLGSAGRSKEFHDYSYKNLGGSLEDHIGAMRQLSKKYSWIDTNRVGIYGHSAGGYDAGHAVLAYPDFYKVAVASSADHDHRMEKAWWPEMYMGWPVDEQYHLQSNITMAGNLKGKLLITHGGIDDNVNPSASFKLAEALIKADKQFDLLILPSQRHGYRGAYRRYFEKTRWNYFVEHLLGEKPVWDFEWE